MLKSRNIAISASSPISRDVNGTSVDTSLPPRRIIIAIFAESARLAEGPFPSWVTFQEACLGQARRLREDYEKLVTEA